MKIQQNQPPSWRTVIILALLLGLVTYCNAQNHFGYEQDKQYAYASVGSSYAKTPYTNNFTPNGIVTVGVRYELADISINYEYVKLTPEYHSYFLQAQIIPLDIHNFEFGAGMKYGRIIRGDIGTYNYFGFNGEIRATYNKFFISLMGSYDYRGDIRYVWGDNSDYWKYTTHLKIGIKI